MFLSTWKLSRVLLPEGKQFPEGKKQLVAASRTGNPPDEDVQTGCQIGSEAIP